MQGMKLDRVRFEDSYPEFPELEYPFFKANEVFQPAQSSQDHRTEKYLQLRQLVKYKGICNYCAASHRPGKNQFTRARRNLGC